jgi:poly-D-alanine transfer protein DltD
VEALVGKKIKGFNDKEQRIFVRMKNGEPHDFAELKTLFWEEAKAHCRKTYQPGWGEDEVDVQAQSFARNSIRRLIRDGWVIQSARGTYRLSKTGKIRISKGVAVTPSANKMSKKTDPDKVKALKNKVNKAEIISKAQKTADKADRENGHKTKIKQTIARAAKESSEDNLNIKVKKPAAKEPQKNNMSIEDRLAAMMRS